MCRKDRPHLIWMDIRMPDMDGYEAAGGSGGGRERRNEGPGFIPHHRLHRG
jgi:DNA-binding LytR/AlgR family response regulator